MENQVRSSLLSRGQCEKDFSRKCPIKHQASSEMMYASIRSNNLGIYLLSPNEKEPRLISQSNRFETHPTQTPDGNAIVYSSNGTGSHHLFLRIPGDEKEYKLTNHSFFEDNPRFHKGYLYFCSDYEGSTHIYRTVWNGKDHEIDIAMAEKITDGNHGRGSDFSFCLSPDGKEIVFCSNKDNLEKYQGPQPSSNYQAGRLYKMEIGKPDTCKPLIEPIVRSVHYWEGTPAYSKDGKYIFYYSTSRGESQLNRYEVSTKYVDSLVQVNKEGSKSLYPSATSDNYILFSYQKRNGKYWKIKRMRSDGSDLATFFTFKQHCWAPQLAEDGSLIFFGTKNLSKPSTNVSLPHGEGSFVVDHGTISRNGAEADLTTIRGYFPTVNKGHLMYIEAMNKVMRSEMDGSNEEMVFKATGEKQCVFALSSSSNGLTVTTHGVPFEGNDSESHIFLLQEGQEPINLTKDLPPARNTQPTITKDGNTIYFSRGLVDQRKHLFSMDITGKKLTQLTDGNRNDVFPAISPCGRFLAFSSTKKKTYQIRLLNLENNSVETLTRGYVDIHVCFSPDGKQLMFTSNRGGLKVETPLSFFFNPQAYGDIYTLDINSRKVTQITSSPFEDSTPTWF